MAKANFELIQPRNTLREKLGGGRQPALDAAALERAEAALKALSSEFQGWMEDEVVKLEAARRLADERQFDDAALEEVYSRAHDAKGMGATYEYPLVTRMAASLCNLLETPEARMKARTAPRLIAAHVDSIRAAVRQRIKSDASPVGAALAGELEAKVRDLLGGAD